MAKEGSRTFLFYLLGIYFGITWIIVTPLLLYYFTKFIMISLRDYNKPQIIKRHPNIIKFFFICISIYIIIDRPLSWLRDTCFTIFTTHESGKTCHVVLISITCVTWPIGTTCAFIFLLTRVWITYFDIKFTQYSLQQKWQILINNDQFDCFKNWFFKHKKNYGNMKYISTRIVYPFCVIIIVAQIVEWALIESLYIEYKTIAITVDSGVILIFVVATIIIGIMCPKFHDHFNIVSEVKYIAFIGLMGVIFGQVLYFIGDLVFGHNGVGDTLIIMGQTLYYVILVAIGLVSQTRWVMKSVERDWRKNLKLQDENSDDTMTIYDILANNEYFEGFIAFLMKLTMNIFAMHIYLYIYIHICVYILIYYFNIYIHIYSEFCAEILISFIEFEQFKRFVIESEGVTINDTHSLHDLCTVIPESSIILNNKHHSRLDDLLQKTVSYKDLGKYEIVLKGKNIKDIIYKKICWELYNKYIKMGSEFEINIDYRTRQSFIENMSNFEKWVTTETSINEYITLFDDCQKQMIQFLNNTYSRFKNSHKYAFMMQSL